ncbi:MAG: putative Ig domain-containing protein, partial [Natronospirillum sp.]
MLRRVCARSVFVALLSGLLTFNALAAENSTVFEERLYVRERGALVTETDHFRINTPKGDYTLKISNGGDYQGQSYDPVTSATLRVNGVTVAGPDAFRQNEPYLERTLALTANENRIEVTLGGKPGGGYRVTITGFENYEPLIRSQPVTGWTDNLDYRYPVVAEDPDDDPLSYSFIEAPPGMTINAGSGLITWAPAATGTFEVTVAVSDGVGGVARQHYALTVTDGTPPVVTPPADIVAEATATETPVDLGRASALDQYDGPLTPTADPTGPFAPGNHTVTWSATDSAGNTGTARQAVTVRDTTPPSLILPDNIITVSDEPVAVDLGHPATSDLFEPVTLSHDAPALFPLGETQVTWTATDANGNTATDSQWVIVEHPDPVGELPPDPTDVAPPLDNPNTSLLDATAFLYTGTNSIQTGVAEGTIEERRAAVIRGRVLDRDNTPLAGVTVTIKGHNEFGQTLSRADGWFDMVVNGGGTLVIDYQKAGYLPVQRQVRPQWNDYAFAEDIVMIPLDSQVSTVQLGNGEAMQVARGSSQTDADGTRQATVLFPEGTTASITLADGSTQSLTTLNVRATEYTVGENGPQAMPGDLPPTSGYTYAVELSVDEAVSAGATRVDFSQPLPVYVDNFIGFPTGAIVPAGWYDRGKAAWIPAKNGRVIEITGISNARAELDIDGSGLAAGGSALAELGIDGIEREKLASLYSPGTTLWRVPVSHFTPWDYNWPYGPSDDAIPPPDTATPNHDATPPEPSDCDTDCGSIIESQSRVLAENIRVSGTPYTLNYRSDRQLGHSSQTKVTIPVIGNDIPDSLMIASVYVDIAGKRHTYHYKTQNPSSYDASTDHDTLRPNTSIELEWNGQDSYGREIGYAKAEVRVTYHYKPQYYPAQDEFEASFGEFGNASPGSGWNSRSGSFITIASNYSQALVNPGFMQATMPASLGGWTL